jgi:ketosteroid isomerase-like protein
MKKWLRALIVAFLSVLAAQAQSEHDAESKVLALERLWGSAAQTRDTKALGSIFDDSLAYVHIDGRLMTKAEVLADTRAVSAVDIVVESSVARSHGNLVIVTGVMKLKGIEKGKQYVRYGRFLDTWMEKGDQWVCLSSMTTAIQK